MSLRRDWAIGRVASETWNRFRADWRALPERAARRWAAVTFAALLLLCALSAAMTLGLRALVQDAALPWEHALLEQVRAWLPLKVAQWLGVPGSGVVVAPAAVLAGGLAAWAGRPLLALSFPLGYALAKAPLLLAWRLWERSRPAGLDGAGAAGGLDAFNAFPSGHIVNVVVLWGLVALGWAQAASRAGERVVAWLVPVLITLAVAFERLRTGAHWPTDIAGGVVLGGLWVAALALAIRAARRARATAGAPDAPRPDPAGRGPLSA